jgi:hypothetical protein
MLKCVFLSILFFSICEIKYVNAQDIHIEVKNSVVLNDYMIKQGEQLHCNFTIETFNSDNFVSSLDDLSIRILDDNEVTNLNLLVFKLRRDIPGCNVYLDTSNSNVIHFVDMKLMRLKDYALNKEISVTYSGLLEGGLVQQISQQVPEISPDRSISSVEPYIDVTTKVNIKANNQSVRRILTDCLSLKNYGSFRWRATTKAQDDGQSTTTIHFYESANQTGK